MTAAAIPNYWITTCNTGDACTGCANLAPFNSQYAHPLWTISNGTCPSIFTTLCSVMMCKLWYPSMQIGSSRMQLPFTSVSGWIPTVLSLLQWWQHPFQVSREDEASCCDYQTMFLTFYPQWPVRKLMLLTVWYFKASDYPHQSSGDTSWSLYYIQGTSTCYVLVQLVLCLRVHNISNGPQAKSELYRCHTTDHVLL